MKRMFSAGLLGSGIMSSIHSLLRSVCDAQPEQPGELVMLATQLGVSPRSARACCKRLKSVMLALDAANDGATPSPLPAETRWLSTVRMGARLLTIEAEPAVAATASRILEQLEGRASNESAARPTDAELRGMIAKSVTERRVLAIEYQGSDGVSAREVEPLSLSNVEGHWTFLAFCRVRKDLRSFRFDRVVSAALTVRHFEPRHGLSLERFLHQQKNRTRARAAV